jgi:hypothetical protein
VFEPSPERRPMRGRSKIQFEFAPWRSSNGPNDDWPILDEFATIVENDCCENSSSKQMRKSFSSLARGGSGPSRAQQAGEFCKTHWARKCYPIFSRHTYVHFFSF